MMREVKLVNLFELSTPRATRPEAAVVLFWLESEENIT